MGNICGNAWLEHRINFREPTTFLCCFDLSTGDEVQGETHLETLDESRLLSADVRARPSVQVDVEVVTGAAGVLAQKSFLRGNDRAQVAKTK